MALSSPGIGSGIDVQGIVQKLMSIEQQPLAKIGARVVELKSQLSAYGSLKGAVSNFRDALGKLSDPAKFKAFAATSSDTAVLSGTASSTAARGTYNLEVLRLAEAHRLAAGTAFAGTSDVVGSVGDRMRISVGGNSFTIDHGGKSVATIRDEINAASDNTGVTASLIRDNVGYRLTLTSNGVGSGSFVSLDYSNAGGAIPDPFALASLNQDRNGTGANVAQTTGPSFNPNLGNFFGVDAGSLVINGVDIGAVPQPSPQTVGMLGSALIDAINARTGDTGVVAELVPMAQDNSLQAIRLRSTTGATFSYTVAAGDPDVRHFFNEGTQTVTGTPDPAPAFTAADLDAAVRLEGQYMVTSSSNTLTDVLQGVTLNLKKAGTTTVTVDRDTAAVQSSVQAFAKSYSDLVALMSKMRNEVLKSDASTLGTIENQMRAVLNSRIEGLGSLTNAFEAGLSTQKNGSLSVDTTMLGKVMTEDYDGLAKLFADPAQGLAKRLYDLADSYLETGGLLDGRSVGLDRQVRESETRKTGIEQRLKIVELRLTKTYNNLDLVVNQLQGTNSALTSQLEAITGFYKVNNR